MSKFVILASVVAVALISVACGETGGPSNSASSVLTGPSGLVASTPDEVSVPAARGGGGSGGGGGKPGGGGNGGGGSTGGSGSLALVMVTDANGNGLPNVGDHVTFNVVTSATSPFVSLNCYQGSSWVYSASVGYFAAYPWAKEFTLSGNSWPGGAADCTARLYTTLDGSSTTTLATISVHVDQ